MSLFSARAFCLIVSFSLFVIHLPAIHLDDVPSPALRRYLRERRETRHLFIVRRGETQETEWGYFDADGDAWIYPSGEEEAVPFPTAGIEALPPDSFYEVER